MALYYTISTTVDYVVVGGATDVWQQIIGAGDRITVEATISERKRRAVYDMTGVVGSNC